MACPYNPAFSRGELQKIVQILFSQGQLFFSQSMMLNRDCEMDVALLTRWRDTECNNADDLLFKGPHSSAINQGREHFIDRWTVSRLGESTVERTKKQTQAGTAFPIHDSRMPVTTGSQSLLASLPSFMSVFGDGLGPRNTSDESATATHASSRPQSSTSRRPSHHTLPSSYAYRRSSSTTLRSDSTESSPTTTISTIDSTLTEPSPSSSPESPSLSLPLSTFNSLKTSSPRSEDGAMDLGSLPNSPPSHITSFSRSDSPNKKMRNTKNLSLNTAGSNKQAYGTPVPRLAALNITNGIHPHAFSAPASPSFIVPPKAPKRKPSSLGLTITTPETNSMGQISRSHSDLIPQTPSISHITTLQRLEEVPSMPVFSPTIAPEGGMQLPPFGASSISNRSSKVRPSLSLSQSVSFDSSHSSPIVLQTLEHVPEENDCELPLSREVKSPAYPEGPVCIYQPGVYLYLEPNDTEASEFDVVINVAREVRNPFELAAERAAAPQRKDAAVQVNLIPGETIFANPFVAEPPSAVSEKSFRSAFEVQPINDDSTIPDTPKVIKSSPEYLHIPWDHNTNVVDDLLRLCELIDDRVSQGKRILVHCQCGVSRSASLIVAYGLYKNPELTVQEAYDAVKERSRWIGPNMHLIYQLAEFKSTLSRKLPLATSKRRNRRSLGMMRTQTDSFMHPKVNSISSVSPIADELSTASLQNDQESTSKRSSSLSPPDSLQHASPMSSGQVTPGPSSAPANVQSSPSGSNTQTRPHSCEMDVTMASPFASRMSSLRMMDIDSDEITSPSSLNSNPLPQNFDNSSQPTVPKPVSSPLLPGGFSSMSLRRNAPRTLSLHEEPHSSNAANNSRLTHISIDHVMTDAVPETPSLLSPRAAEFTASPFHRTAAGDLAGSSVYEQGLLSPGSSEKDPRSPPMWGEAPITRSIDGVL